MNPVIKSYSGCCTDSPHLEEMVGSSEKQKVKDMKTVFSELSLLKCFFSAKLQRYILLPTKIYKRLMRSSEVFRSSRYSPDYPSHIYCKSTFTESFSEIAQLTVWNRTSVHLWTKKGSIRRWIRYYRRRKLTFLSTHLIFIFILMWLRFQIAELIELYSGLLC